VRGLGSLLVLPNTTPSAQPLSVCSKIAQMDHSPGVALCLTAFVRQRKKGERELAREEAALMMRRILVLLTVAAVMAVMMVVSAVPAFAIPSPPD
jgi:hypothetical protein